MLLSICKYSSGLCLGEYTKLDRVYAWVYTQTYRVCTGAYMPKFDRVYAWACTQNFIRIYAGIHAQRDLCLSLYAKIDRVYAWVCTQKLIGKMFESIRRPIRFTLESICKDRSSSCLAQFAKINHIYAWVYTQTLVEFVLVYANIHPKGNFFFSVTLMQIKLGLVNVDVFDFGNIFNVYLITFWILWIELTSK